MVDDLWRRGRLHVEIGNDLPGQENVRCKSHENEKKRQRCVGKRRQLFSDSAEQQIELERRLKLIESGLDVLGAIWKTG